jgi:hypothetical protein
MVLGPGDRQRMIKVELRKAKQQHDALLYRKTVLQQELITARSTLRGFDRRLRCTQLAHEIKSLSPDLREASARLHGLTIDLERMQT